MCPGNFQDLRQTCYNERRVDKEGGGLKCKSYIGRGFGEAVVAKENRKEPLLANPRRVVVYQFNQRRKVVKDIC